MTTDAGPDVGRRPGPVSNVHRTVGGLASTILLSFFLLSACSRATRPEVMVRNVGGIAPVESATSLIAPGRQRYPLNDEAREIAKTAGGREIIKYLANCALPEGVVAFVHVDSTHYEFPGAVGLVPDWVHRSLTEDEQRWVSACILARTNYFGVEVQISMRHPATTITALQTTDQERKEFSLYEGDFFGNLFAEPPVAAVSRARRSKHEPRASVLKRRVCTEVDSARPEIDGKPLSRCNFIITGFFDEADAHMIAGQRYDAYISVYLKPDAPSNKAKRANKE